MSRTAADGGRAPRALAVLLSAVLALGAFGAAVGADAAEAPTRADYVSRLERICKPRALATQRAMRGARADLLHERLGLVAGKFARAMRYFGSTVKLISRVPRPPADLRRLHRWFVFLGRQQAYLKRIYAWLRARGASRRSRAQHAQRLTARFIHNGNLANNVALPFGFEYCSFKFSRYG